MSENKKQTDAKHAGVKRAGGLFALANPARFRRMARPLRWGSGVAALVLLCWGAVAAFQVPPDYLQQEAVRIMYVHVPAAWLGLAVYASLGVAGLSFLVFRHTLAALYIRAMAPVGATLTGLCLLTGMLWGYPTWGTFWVWDARLTSVLILFFLYFGIIAADGAFRSRDRGLSAAAWLAVLGMINLPIIKFSVDWWTTLHQTASISTLERLRDPAIHDSMIGPLWLMAGGYLMLCVFLGGMRLETEILRRKTARKQADARHTVTKPTLTRLRGKAGTA